MFKSGLKFIQKQDIYGHKIRINYKGKNDYKTRLGGFISFATFVMIAIYTLGLLKDYFEIVQAQEENFTRRMQELHDIAPYHLQENSFNIIVSN